MSSVLSSSGSVAAGDERVVLSGLARALVQHQIMRVDQAVVLQNKASAEKTAFIDELLASGSMKAPQLARFCADAFGCPLMDLSSLDLNNLPTGLLDPKLAAETKVIPLMKRGNKLSIAVSDPADFQALDRIKFSAEATVDAIVVEHDKLMKLLEKLGKSANEQLGDLSDDAMDVEMTSDEQASAVSDAEIDDAPVVKFLQKVLLDAINAGASDLHFEPYEKFYRIRYRIDGELREISQPPLAIKEKLASRIKVISKLDISEKRIPQDGRMKLVMSAQRAIDFRVSTLPTLFGEKIVMRILDPSSAKLGIDALGYDPDQKELLMNAVQRPYGMVLVTGPTGSGKTVSLYT